MRLNKPYLIIDLNDNKIIFFVVSFDEKKNFKVLKNIFLQSLGIQNGRIIDIEIVSKLVKKTVNDLEEDLDYYFSDTTIIINPNQINCLNVSGYKKLNGAQVSNEDITYILNDIKNIILDSEKNYFLVHLFNSNFSLDSDNLDSLPIGLFGDFYNQNMTFFLANKNILKNIKSVFNNCGLNIEKIILKSFVDGINLLTDNSMQKNFTILRLEKNRINISLFKNKSFVFTQDFNFGFDLIMQDISKLCSLKIPEVEFFFKEVELKNELENGEETYLEKKYFTDSPFRKIKHQLIFDIITARLEEFLEVCHSRNINIKNLRNNDKLYVYVESHNFYKNIKYILEKNMISTTKLIFNNFAEQNLISSVSGACELISKGWDKEAIPVVIKRKSFISGFFSKLFS